VRAVLIAVAVAPDRAWGGAGSAVFRAGAEWAGPHGCRELFAETQNVNVPACRFYEAQGCTISEVTEDAYRHYPDEVEIIWKLNL
jgi:GNAT superfamily N-acetyltransferase